MPPKWHTWHVALLLFFLLASICINIFQFRSQARQLYTQDTARADVLEDTQRQLDELGVVIHRRASSSNTSANTASSTNAAAGSCGSSGSSGHQRHQQVALLWLFNAMLIGTAVIHIQSYYHNIQVTVVLFLLGMISTIVLEGLELYEEFGIFGDSYKMWLDIDPHLLLFTMLPTLLAGDAMSIDTQVASRVAYQCLYLAGPGVIFCSMVIAGFLHFYLDWTFLLSLCTGSILCATDPVAVVALLKELGASPILTVQIQGESLLNDGTAIVLYTIAYRKLSGEEYEMADIGSFLVQTAFMAVGFGVFCGYAFFYWLTLSFDRFNHHADLIQILITFGGAYWIFFIAEGCLDMSGVLATVFSSLVLAHCMWPHIVNVHSMHVFWHTIESLGNIVIFLLGGALCGAAMVHIAPINYLHLIVIYIFLTIVRAAFIFGSLPVLRWLSPDGRKVSWQDACVMTWGGLRGAVGLALAIQVNRGRAADTDGNELIEKEEAELVLFFVSGVAFLTTCINALTAPALVAALGITRPPRAQLELMMKFNKSLLAMADKDGLPAEVMRGLEEMIQGIEGIESTRINEVCQRRKSIAPIPMTMRKTVTLAKNGIRNLLGQEPDKDWDPKDHERMIERFRSARKRFERYTAEEAEFLCNVELSPDILTKKRFTDGQNPMDHCIALLTEFTSYQKDFSKVVNHAFLSLVRIGYSRLTDLNELRPGSEEATTLNESVNVALSSKKVALSDYDYIVEHFSKRRKATSVFDTKCHLNDEEKGWYGVWIESLCFNAFFSVAIVINCVYVAIEEIGRGGDNHIFWLLIELTFASIFTLEFLLKFKYMRSLYFRDPWNVMDFGLGLLGLVGALITVMAQISEDDGSSQTRVIRLARVLRSMRFLRIFRLVHARMNRRTEVSHELDQRMTQISTYGVFAAAQVQAQTDMFQYFCANAELDREDDVEFARCLLQSQTNVYNAWSEVIEVEKTLDHHLLEAVHRLYERKHITERLEKYVEKAQDDGAIGVKQATKILHPLHEQIAACQRRIHDTSDGRVRKSLFSVVSESEIMSRSPTGAISMAGDTTSDPSTGQEADHHPLLHLRDSDTTLPTYYAPGTGTSVAAMKASGRPPTDSTRAPTDSTRSDMLDLSNPVDILPISLEEPADSHPRFIVTAPDGLASSTSAPLPNTFGAPAFSKVPETDPKMKDSTLSTTSSTWKSSTPPKASPRWKAGSRGGKMKEKLDGEQPAEPVLPQSIAPEEQRQSQPDDMNHNRTTVSSPGETPESGSILDSSEKKHRVTAKKKWKPKSGGQEPPRAGGKQSVKAPRAQTEGQPVKAN